MAAPVCSVLAATERGVRGKWRPVQEMGLGEETNGVPGGELEKKMVMEGERVAGSFGFKRENRWGDGERRPRVKEKKKLGLGFLFLFFICQNCPHRFELKAAIYRQSIFRASKLVP